MIYVFWTCRNKEEAKEIIFELLDRRLIACASIIPETESIYRWEGKIEQALESKVILKSLSKYFEEIQGYIISRCSYEVPEITQVNIAKANPLYLSWISESLSG